MRLLPDENEKKPVAEPKWQRVGSMRIPSGNLWDNISLMHEIFAKLQFVPLRVEHLFEPAEFFCVGVSPLFAPIKSGAPVIAYRLHAKLNPDGSLKELTVSPELSVKINKE